MTTPCLAMAVNEMGFQSSVLWLGAMFAVIFIVFIGGGSRIPLIRRYAKLDK